MADVFERNGYRPAAQKYGQGHATAMARLGLKELRNAANPSPQSVADTEHGLYGTVSPAQAGQQQGFRGNTRGQDPAPAQQQDRNRGY
jgi:hypothetical protein